MALRGNVLAVVGLALGVLGVLPWLLKERGLTGPPWLVTTGGFLVVAMLAIALAAVARAFFRVLVNEARASVGAVALAALLAGIAGTAWYGAAPSDPFAPIARRTSLRLQFYGDERIRTEVHSDNVFRWFALWHPAVRIGGRDKTGKPAMPEVEVKPKTWTIFVTFDRPIVFRELVVSFSAP